MKKTLTVAIATALVFMLSGCFRMHVNLVLEEDDKASGGIVFAVSDDAAGQVGMSPSEFFEAMLEQAGGTDDIAPEGSTQTEYAADGYTGMEFTFESKPINEAADVGELSVTREGDDYVVSGSLEDLAGGGGDEAAQFMSSADVAINITFPGKVSDANGEINGNTVTWKAVPGEALDLSARGSAVSDSSSSSLMKIIGIVLAVLVVGAIIAAIVISRSRRSSAGSDGPSYALPHQDSTAPAAVPVVGANPGENAIPVVPAVGEENAGVGSATSIAEDTTPGESSSTDKNPDPDKHVAAGGAAAPGESSAPVEDVSPDQTGYAPPTSPGVPEYPLPPADPENPENPQQ